MTVTLKFEDVMNFSFVTLLKLHQAVIVYAWFGNEFVFSPDTYRQASFIGINSFPRNKSGLVRFPFKRIMTYLHVYVKTVLLFLIIYN